MTCWCLLFLKALLSIGHWTIVTSVASYCPPESFHTVWSLLFSSTTNKAWNDLPVPTELSGNLLGKHCRLQEEVQQKQGAEYIHGVGWWNPKSEPRWGPQEMIKQLFHENKNKDLNLLNCCSGSRLCQGCSCWCLRVCALLTPPALLQGASRAAAKAAFPFSPSAFIREEILSVCLGEVLVCPQSSRSL